MSQAILAYLQRAEDGVTIAEISLATGLNLLPTGPLPIRLAPIPGVGPVTPQTEGATP